MIFNKIKNWAHLIQARQSAKKYGYPHRFLKLIGVTGTDGKTTTVSLIYHILKECGLSTAYLSTVEAKIGSESLDTGFHVTTPDPWELPKYIDKMVKANIEYAVLEATSNGLDQNRFGDMKFDAAVITNIKHDHLDYHKTWQNYAKAKFKLIEKIKDEGVAVLNSDDLDAAKWLRGKAKDLKQTVYVKWASKKNVENIDPEFSTLGFTYGGVRFEIPVMGSEYNLENILQAVMLCESIVPLEDISKALRTFHLPKGRMNVIIEDPIKVIVDFAHTQFGLKAVLKALRKLIDPSRRIITVFGCAGERDKGRREMGAVSAMYSDITVLTAEDPRSEGVKSINYDIFSRAKKEGADIIAEFINHEDYSLTGLGEIHANLETAWKREAKPFILFNEDNRNSRKDAIELAIRLARRGDLVIITGKGHEQSLSFGKSKKEFKWSDQEQVEQALERLQIS